MKLKMTAAIGAAALLCTFGVMQAFAAAENETVPENETAPAVAESFSATEREEKLEEFIGSLTEAQKSAFDELFPNGGKIGFGGGFHGGLSREMTEEEKAEMEAAQAEREEKLNAFIAALTDEQKALYEIMTPDPPAEGETPVKPDEAAIAEMEAAREAFIASLTEEQKAAYEEIAGSFGNMGHAGRMGQSGMKHGRGGHFGSMMPGGIPGGMQDGTMPGMMTESAEATESA